MEWLHYYSLCTNASTSVRIYVYVYMHIPICGCTHTTYLRAVTLAIVSSYVLIPLQAPFSKSSCTELINVSEHKNTQKVDMIVLM